MKRFAIFAAILAIAAPSWAKLPKVKTEADIDALVASMTLDEKIGQLNQLSGWGYHPEMIAKINAGTVGSLLNEVDPATVNKLQREAVENSRLGIPLVFARDVIHGFKTIFPIPLGLAATWDAALVEEGARIAADEASSVGVRWTFSPMLDISRDGRWGRIAESFGEDPLLTSRLGAAMVKGYQGDDLSKPNTMAACVKHFAGYGASESGLDYNNVWMPTPLLRDVYLPGYKAAIDAGAATLMCSFNDLYGKPVWVTEFCYWPGGAGNVYVAPQAQLASLMTSLEWLEKTEWIYRYSWFKAIGDHDAANKPNYGLLVNASGLGERELSPQGWAYVYMTDFDPEVWNKPGDVVAATEYIASSGLIIGKGENSSCPRPVEISQFYGGTYADYQFDIPKDGDYVLTLTVSGQGEPTRFDPSLSLSLLDGDGNVASTLAETGTFTLSGKDNVYTTVDMMVSLKAGRQTLRLAEGNPSRPSGIRISTLTLNDAAGVADTFAAESTEPQYYDLRGFKVDATTLTPGIYIVRQGLTTTKVFVSNK